jgi:hypothetical protein
LLQEQRGLTIPAVGLRLGLIQRAHTNGHFGVMAIYAHLTKHDRVWWPSLRSQIDSVIRQCSSCQRFTLVNHGFHPIRSPASNIVMPFDHLQIDTICSVKTSFDGYNFILAVVDSFTGFLVLRPLRNKTTAAIAVALWEIFSNFGFPRFIQSDSGGEFVSDLIDHLCKHFGMSHRLVVPYLHKGNGKIERTISTVVSSLCKTVEGATDQWTLFLPFVQASYNQNISAVTGSSPFALMFNRVGRPFNSLILEDNDDSSSSAASPTSEYLSLEDWKIRQQELVDLVYPALSERLTSVRAVRSAKWNQTKRLLKSPFVSGAVVMIRDVLRVDKSSPIYVGPYSIVRRMASGAYLLRSSDGDLLDRPVDASHIKLVSRTPMPIYDDVWTVDKILQHRGVPGKYSYLTKWKGFPLSEATWEPSANFQDFTVIETYWKKPTPSSAVVVPAATSLSAASTTPLTTIPITTIPITTSSIPISTPTFSSNPNSTKSSLRRSSRLQNFSG